MKIAVLCLASRTGGGLTVLRDLYRFALRDETNEWIFLLSDQDVCQERSEVEVLRLVPKYGGWVSRIRAELTVVPRAIRESHADVLLSLQNMDTLLRGTLPLAVYMHQPMPFSERRPRLSRRGSCGLAIKTHILGWFIRASIRRSEVTFVQTKWIEESVRSHCPRANLVRLGIPGEETLTRFAVKRRETRQFIYPAAAIYYKDHRTLRRAVAIARLRNPNIGPVMLTLSRPEFERVAGRLSEHEAQSFQFIGTVDQSELATRYSESLLVFPSFLETLGLPLYEARAARCHVVAADTPFAREALDGYGATYFAEVGDPPSLANAMLQAWANRGNEISDNQLLSPEGELRGWSLMLAHLDKIVQDSRR